MIRKLPALLVVGLIFVLLSAGCAQTPSTGGRDLNAEALQETSLGRWGELRGR